ncbi:MAG: VWA domain-containing protein [Clostridia bacterium]|nr:VWA domain-containing protein [Clostridia bacterium]
MGIQAGNDIQEGKQLKELHMFYLLDISGSMEGEGIQQLNSGMRETVRILKDKFEGKGDAHLRISVMTFSNAAQWVTGTPDSKYSEYIEDFIDFPEQTAAGLTHLGDALTLLQKGLSREEMLESPTGNKRPIIIVMSDGAPNDDWESALKKIQENRCSSNPSRSPLPWEAMPRRMFSPRSSATARVFCGSQK